jgi:hypothetical protein
MDRDEMEAAFSDVSNRLSGEEISARIFVIGGAAMVLAFSARFSTADVDADFYPPDVVRAVARQVAAERGLPEDWLSDAAKGFLPSFKEPDWRPVFRFDHLEVSTADERSLLAMKLRASRGRRDIGDIRLLLRLCDVDTVGQALGIYDEYFPDDPLPERATPLLKRALSQES